MKRSVLLLALLVVASTCGAIGGCTSRSTSAPSQATPVSVAEKNAGETIELKMGQMLVVDLPANPSTGYTWAVTTLPSIVETTGEPQYAGSSVESEVVGAGGTMSYTFRTVGSGSGKLELGYRRPWETTVAPVQTYSLNLDAK